MLFAYFVAIVTAVEWYWFFWKFLPVAAVIMEATDTSFSEITVAFLNAAYLIGALWWVLLPLVVPLSLWVGLSGRFGRHFGSFLILALSVLVQLCSSLVFLAIGYQALTVLDRTIG